MKRRIVKSLTALVLVLLLPVSVVLAGGLLPSYYGESYYAELSSMYERLYQAEGKKLVLIGGSNISFGVDTALLEETLAQYGYDYTVCPFGLYAAVGASAMLELSKDALSSGDLVVLAVEPTNDTLSTYFGATAFWKCCEDAPQMLLHLNDSQKSAMIGNYIGYTQERVSIWQTGDPPKAEGVYAKASFDESCNLVYPREGNAMALGYDTAAAVDFGDIQIEAAFAQQVNEFCAFAQSRGASVFWSFSPVNRAAVENADETGAFFLLCNKTFVCPVISAPADYLLDSGWFYDSNFHLNDAGAKVRTMQLAQDLLAQLGCYQELAWTEPAMPEPIGQVQETPGDEDFFTYEPLNGGWLVSGVTEAGETALTVPAAVEGKPVVGFVPGALDDADALEELTLPQSIESLPDGLFSECKQLQRLVLLHTDFLCSITENTFTGADRLKIFVPAQSYHLYRDGDGCEVNPWSNYLERIFSY